MIMLGLNNVKNIAMSAAILDNLGKKRSLKVFSMDEFWTHSICVGVTAKALAGIKEIPILDREEYFVAGLLHDLGKIPLYHRFPGEYVKALELARLDQIPLYHAENELLEIDHCMVGGLIAEKWQLSRALVDTLSHHHDPDEADEENSQLISIVALGDINSNIIEIETPEEKDAVPEEPILNDLLERIGVSRATLSGLHEPIIEEIEKAKDNR